MSTIRFGSSVGPSRITGTVQELVGQREDMKVDDADPNVLMQCPYDKNHQIRACRFPFHIIKCAVNHPELASKLKMCPFNAKHLLPSHEMAHHIEHCKNKPLSTTEDDCSENMNTRFHVPIQWTPPACQEDWEAEADDNAPTFVWGVTTQSRLSVNQPESLVTSNLTTGVRAPRTLPWNNCEFWY